MIKASNRHKVLSASVIIAALSLAIVGCSAGEDSANAIESDGVVSEELSEECTSAPFDTFVPVNTDCAGCTGGRYVVASSSGYASPPCRPNYILQVGGNQKTFNFVATWNDKVPTQADVPPGGDIANVCRALKLTIAGNYRLNDLPTRVATGVWNGTRCVPPRIEFDFTHVPATGLPGEFFAHARFLISAETAITKGKKFVVNLCRGANSC